MYGHMLEVAILTLAVDWSQFGRIDQPVSSACSIDTPTRVLPKLTVTDKAPATQLCPTRLIVKDSAAFADVGPYLVSIAPHNLQ